MALSKLLVLVVLFISTQIFAEGHDEAETAAAGDTASSRGSTDFSAGFEEWKKHETSPEKWNAFVGQWENPELYFDNNDAYDLRIKLLDNAPKGATAKILSFVFDVGQTTKKLASHMCLAAQRGVNVQFMVDSKAGSIPGQPNIFNKEDAEEIFQYLANCGVKVKIYNHIKDFETVLGKAIPGKDLLKECLKDPVHCPLNRLNHRKLFWVENPPDKNGKKNACMLLGGRNLGDHYQHWDGKGDSWMDVDTFTCRHMFKGENEKSAKILDKGAESFNDLYNDDSLSYTVKPNPDFKYRNLVFEPKSKFEGVEFARPDHEWNNILSSGGHLDSKHPLRTLASERTAEQKKELERLRMPPAMPVHAPFSKVHGIEMRNTENWQFAGSTWNPKRDEIRKALYEAIDKEQCEIFIETPYLEMDEEMKGKLEAALKRGVNVTLVTNGLFTSDGVSGHIRLYEGRFIKGLLNEYAAKDSAGNPVPLNQRLENPELQAKGRFWYYNTTIHANHMLHFKGAGFKCQKEPDKNGKAVYKKRFLIGSHNFHARSGLSDKEHAVIWDEPVDKAGLAQAAIDRGFDPDELLRLSGPAQKECPDKVAAELAKDKKLKGEAYITKQDQLMRICISAATQNALAKIGRRYFSDSELAKIDRKYNTSTDGILGTLNNADRDMVDRRIKFYSQMSAIYKGAKKPLIIPYTSLAEELDTVLQGPDADKLSRYEKFKAKMLRRIIFTDASGKPEVRGDAHEAADFLKPLFNYTQLFF